MKTIRAVKLSHFVIEEILFILKSFRPTDVLYKEMSKRCSDEVAIFRAQFNFWLRSIVDCKQAPTIAAAAAVAAASMIAI